MQRIDFYVPVKNPSNGAILMALVDAADAAMLSRYKWRLQQGYAARSYQGHSRLMQRDLIEPPTGMDTDHINGNKLNNRRTNLRIATRAQNQCNRGKDLVGRSEFKGVDFHPKTKKWRCRISDNGKRLYLGLFDTEEEAGAVYKAAAIRLHGEFAHPNLVGNPTAEPRNDWRQSAGVFEVTLES